MDRDRFAALADAYGADISRWPAETQHEAAQAAREPWAAALLADASRLDALLVDAGDRVDPRRTAAVIGRVSASIASPRPAWWVQWVMPLSGLAAAGVLGVVFGIGTIQAASASAGMGDMLVAMLSYSDTMFSSGLGG